jgi:hypothetical protein
MVFVCLENRRWGWMFDDQIPWKSCGNLTGRITASFKASFACSKPITSANETFGSATIAPIKSNEYLLQKRLN